MCLATNILDSQIKELEEQQKEMQREISYIDKKLSEFYHKLEMTKFNASEGYYIAKDMQEILRKRRNVKFQSSQVCSMIAQHNKTLNHLKKNEKRYFSDNTSYKEYVTA